MTLFRAGHVLLAVCMSVQSIPCKQAAFTPIQDIRPCLFIASLTVNFVLLKAVKLVITVTVKIYLSVAAMSNLRSSCELTPENRLKALVEYSGRMEMNPTITTKLYYKSGLNMYKQFLYYYKVVV